MRYEMPPLGETECTLPELPPDNYFTNSLYDEIAKAFWRVTDDPEKAELVDQFPDVVESFNPRERFNVAALMYYDDNFPHAEGEEGERVILWGIAPDKLTIDETGRVYAKDDIELSVIGHVDDVLTFIRKYYVPNKGEDLRQATIWLEEHFLARITYAFENFINQEAGDKAEQAIRDETNRRIKLPKKNNSE